MIFVSEIVNNQLSRQTFSKKLEIPIIRCQPTPLLPSLSQQKNICPPVSNHIRLSLDFTWGFLFQYLYSLDTNILSIYNITIYSSAN